MNTPLTPERIDPIHVNTPPPPPRPKAGTPPDMAMPGPELVEPIHVNTPPPQKSRKDGAKPDAPAKRPVAPPDNG